MLQYILTKGGLFMLLSKFEDYITVIQSVDREAQIEFLNLVLDSRYGKDTRGNRITAEFLLGLGCFYVPNDDYLFNLFGDESDDPAYGFYEYDDSCKWVGHIMLPIKDALNRLVGFSAYNPLSRLIRADNKKNNTDNPVPPKYIDSPSKVFNKAKYLLVPLGYEKMIRDDYILIVDGFFDALSLAYLGFNSAANLGTLISAENLYTLSLPSRRLVISDNDDAGVSLYKSINSIGKQADHVLQAKGKDIDEFIYKVGKNESIKQLKSAIEHFGLGCYVLGNP